MVLALLESPPYPSVWVSCHGEIACKNCPKSQATIPKVAHNLKKVAPNHGLLGWVRSYGNLGGSTDAPQKKVPTWPLGGSPQLLLQSLGRGESEAVPGAPEEPKIMARYPKVERVWAV